jgi:Sigma-70 region 2
MSHDVAAPGADAAGRPVAELFASDYDGLRRLARLLTRSDALAEDMVQEAFLRLQASGTRPDNPGGYLRTVVVNLCRPGRGHQPRHLPGPSYMCPSQHHGERPAVLNQPGAAREDLQLVLLRDHQWGPDLVDDQGPKPQSRSSWDDYGRAAARGDVLCDLGLVCRRRSERSASRALCRLGNYRRRADMVGRPVPGGICPRAGSLLCPR